MEAVTGKAIVTSMMRLATEMSSWNKAYATEGKVAKRIEELGLTPHQAQMLGCLYSNPEGQSVLNAFQAGGRRLCAEKSGKGWR